MAEEKLTSEEKLLRLIESPGKTKASKSLKGIRPKTLGPKAWIKGLNLKEKAGLLNLNSINKGLAGLAIVLTAFLVFDFFRGQPEIDWSHPGRTYAAAERTEEAPSAKLLSLTDYQNEFKRRNVFSTLTQLDLAKEKATAEFASLVSDLKLVGIIWAKNPQAIIEDKKEQKTYLLNPGEEIRKIKIKQILRDRIIIGLNGEEMELM